MKRLVLGVAVVVVLVGVGHLKGEIVQWDVASGDNGHSYEAVYVGMDGITFSDAKDAAAAQLSTGLGAMS